MPTVELRAKASLDGSGFSAGITRMERGIKGLSNSLNNTLKSRVAAAFSIGAISLAVKKTIDYGGQINDMAKRLGVGVEKLQAFGYAAKKNGAELEDFVGFLDRLNSSRDDALNGNEKLVKSFEQLGVSLEDLKTKRADELTGIIGNSVKTGDQQKLIAPLKDIGGRGAGVLMAAFIDGLQENEDEARKAGLIIKEQVISELDKIGDELTILGQALISNLAPATILAVDRIYDLIDTIKILGLFVGNTLNEFDPKKFLADFVIGGAAHAMARLGSEAGVDKKGIIEAGLNEIAKDRAAREAQRGQTITQPVNTPFQEGEESPNVIQPKIRRAGIESDQLTAVGNFLGGRQDAIAQLAERQVNLLQSIDRNISRIANETDQTGYVA